MANKSRSTAPKAVRPIGIDLFAGAGGMSLGFEQAGFDVVAAIEIDPIHCAAHKFNFPNCAVIPHSISQLTGEQIRKAANIGNRKVDCVFGGPPCQGFSLIGQRVLDDPRNSLVNDFVRLVSELDADTFVFENVKGLTLGKHRVFLEELVRAFEQRGYDVRLPWRVLNASMYGVPQNRERLILFGAKRGMSLPDYPLATTNPADKQRQLIGLPLGPSCGDALGDLPDADRFATLLEADSVVTSSFKAPSVYASQMRCLTDEDWHFSVKRLWKPEVLTSSARTIHSDISRARFQRTSQGEVEPISRFFKLPRDGVSNTLRAGTDGARGAFTSPRPVHFKHPRCVTVREMARLHGFPDWFRFHATKWHGARQVGNSVPPPLARAIAGSVTKALGVNPIIPKNYIPLGDPALLQMDLSEAAKHFGVQKPNSTRDRKSGAKKRKQSEVEAVLASLRTANG